MKTIVISIAVFMLASCMTREERLANRASEFAIIDRGCIKCVSIVIVGFANDSCVFYNKRAFAIDPGRKDSSSVSEKWVKGETEALIKYNGNIDSISVTRDVFDVYRRNTK